MDPEKKEEIIKDLIKFSESKDYYARMGKAWKRGYLLYGPPGTGKTTMIASMANLLHFDVYDLELTTVTNNTALRRLLIDTEPKSIIVIEDIDCSLDLTGQRRKKKEDKEEKKNKKKKSSKSLSQVTLSGLLNFIDGLWSACGEERIIVFTTNHLDQLDPALIRSGRMDFHIEMSYCCFEAFKVMAKNYLGVESHPLFDTIQGLLEEIKISPADVAENLMPKTFDFDATTSLQTLIRALEKGELVEIMEAKEDEEDDEEEDDQTETDKDGDEEDDQTETDKDGDEEDEEEEDDQTETDEDSDE